MSSPRSLQGGVVPLGATLVIALLASTSAEAQAERSRTRKAPALTVISVTGKGTTTGQAAPPPTRRGGGAPLDWSLIKAAVKTSSGKDVTSSKAYVTLTPEDPTDPTKGRLSFTGEVNFLPPELHLTKAGTSLTISFHPEAAGKSYIVDVLVQPDQGLSLTYQLPDGSSRDEAAFSSGGEQHILFLVQAANDSYQGIRLVVKAGGFRFVSATVTGVQ